MTPPADSWPSSTGTGANEMAALPTFITIDAALSKAAAERLRQEITDLIAAARAESTTVRTVGDLTARHIGKTVRVEGYDVLLGSIGHSSTGTRYTGHVIRDGKRYGSIRAERQNSETPCEVLP